jgi:hypothetical protein
MTVFELADEYPSDSGTMTQFLLSPSPLQAEFVNPESKTFSKIFLHISALRVYDGLQHCLSATRRGTDFRAAVNLISMDAPLVRKQRNTCSGHLACPEPQNGPG